jgi:hypothetical protein
MASKTETSTRTFTTRNWFAHEDLRSLISHMSLSITSIWAVMSFRDAFSLSFLGVPASKNNARQLWLTGIFTLILSVSLLAFFSYLS